MILLKLMRIAFLALFLSLVFVSIKLSIKEDERNYDWRNNSDGTVTIIYYNGAHMNFSFPDRLNGKEVTKISSGIFQKREFYNILPTVY